MRRPAGVQDLPEITLPEGYQTNPGPFLADMHDQYGPIFRATTLWGDRIIYMVGPEANRFVLATRSHIFSHQIGWNQTERVAEIFGTGLVFSDGAIHDRDRLIMSPAFRRQHFDTYLRRINDIIGPRIARWGDRDEIDVFAEAHAMTFDVVAMVLMGLSLDSEIDELRDLFFRLEQLDFGSPIDQRKIEQKITARIVEILLPILKSRRQCSTNDLLSALASARDEHGWVLDGQQFVAEANTILLAGHITTASLCAWVFYLLQQHPEYAARVVREQFELLDQYEEPTVEAIDRMEVLERAVRESERMFPPIANLPRGVLEPFEFGGYLVPVGSFVFLSIAGSHRIESVFADPDRFDPDRFAPPRREHLRTPYSLIGFSGGPRMCLGVHFARMEIKAIVSHALRRFQLELSPDCHVAQLYHPISVPLNGIRMLVRRWVQC